MIVIEPQDSHTLFQQCSFGKSDLKMGIGATSHCLNTPIELNQPNSLNVTQHETSLDPHIIVITPSAHSRGTFAASTSAPKAPRPLESTNPSNPPNNSLDHHNATIDFLEEPESIVKPIEAATSTAIISTKAVPNLEHSTLLVG
jgi:hypothetical protein